MYQFHMFRIAIYFFCAFSHSVLPGLLHYSIPFYLPKACLPAPAKRKLENKFIIESDLGAIKRKDYIIASILKLSDVAIRRAVCMTSTDLQRWGNGNLALRSGVLVGKI